MIIVFDLDEVLYDEKTYVISGFRTVSEFLEKDEAIPKKIIFEYLKRRLKNCRERILNDLLDNFRIYSQKNLKKCISVYRTHTPKIKLYSDAKDCLKRLKNYPLYIVTDGNKIVQKNKIKALNLENCRKKGKHLPDNYTIIERLFYRTLIYKLPDQINLYKRIFSQDKVSIHLLDDLSDDIDKIISVLDKWLEIDDLNLILTTGGTGIGPRDVTPEATKKIIDYEIPGIPELMRVKNYSNSDYVSLSRSVAGVKSKKLIVNLPGSVKAVTENLQIVYPLLKHAIELINGNTKH